MNRRTFLQQLGGGGLLGLSGCVSPPAPSSSSPVSDGVQRRISLAGQDSVPDEHQVSITAEVLESIVTDDYPARVRIAITNHGDERRFSSCAVFDRESLGSNPPGLWLEDSLREDDQTGEQWIKQNLPGPGEGFGGKGCGWQVYDSGESTHTTYAILHDGRTDGYFTPGTYRWEEDVHIIPKQSQTVESDEETTITWGFSLTVENPG